MKKFIIAVLQSATQAVELEHFAGRPPLMIHHVADSAKCNDLNAVGSYALPGTPLFYFDREACACLYDEYYLD